MHTLNLVQIVRADGHQLALAADVLVQFLLQREEALERASPLAKVDAAQCGTHLETGYQRRCLKEQNEDKVVTINLRTGATSEVTVSC